MTATDRADHERRQRVRAVVERLEASPYEHHRELAAAMRRLEARRHERERPDE